MIVFHGTLGENIKAIKKAGILDYTDDQWLLEIVQRKVCCVSNQPISGEGGNASFFAYSFVRSKNQDGYLVVLDIPYEILKKKIIAIFDNKTLDDYVRFHFFVREEFRYVGYALFKTMTKYRSKDRYFRKFGDNIGRRTPKQEEAEQYSNDQRAYYKKLRQERYVYQFEDVIIHDELWDMFQYIGNWQRVYEFLAIHFSNIPDESVLTQKNNIADHSEYWRSFYTTFSLHIPSPREEHFQDWFSPQWLAKRKIDEPNENCQFLCQKIEPEYIAGFIQITTPSGFSDRFRNFRSKSAFSREVWKEAHRLLKEK